MLTGNIRGHLSECPIYAWVELEDATLITSSRHPNHFRSCSICAGWVYCTSIVRCECVATANGYQCTSTQGPVIHIQYYPEYVSTIAGPESKINELFVGIYSIRRICMNYWKTPVAVQWGGFLPYSLSYVFPFVSKETHEETSCCPRNCRLYITRHVSLWYGTFAFFLLSLLYVVCWSWTSARVESPWVHDNVPTYIVRGAICCCRSIRFMPPEFFFEEVTEFFFEEVLNDYISVPLPCPSILLP